MQPLLPYRPHPKEDELLTSWLSRMATGLGLKLHSFTKLILPTFQIWNRDIDRSAPDEMLKALVEATGIPYVRLLDTTLRTYEGYTIEHFNLTGTTTLINTIGVWHRKRKDFGLAYCPACLAEDGDEPYFRRKWRLSIIVSCVKHELQLRDRCPACNAPISFHRNDYNDRSTPTNFSLDSCYQCKTPLHIYPGEKENDISLLIFQAKIEHMIRTGWTFIFNNPVYSFLFLRVVRQLMRIFLSEREECQRLQKICAEKLGINPPMTHSKPEIERLMINERRMALQLTNCLLNDWPAQFIQIIKKTALLRTPFIRDMRNVPYWFDRILWKHFDGRLYDPAHDEITTAVNYLQGIGRSITPRELCNILGLRDSKNITKYCKQFSHGLQIDN